LAALLLLLPLLGFGLAGETWTRAVQRLPVKFQIMLPAVSVACYLLVVVPAGLFAWHWLALYLLLPPAVTALLSVASARDPEQGGHWLDWLVLLVLGLTVDLRWLGPAWPHHLTFLNKLLLFDVGLYGFQAVRRLDGVGLDLRWRWRDWKLGTREFFFYAPIAIALGLAIGFLHIHRHVAHPWWALAAWCFTYVTIALPEETFFRGWMQNLMERRLGRTASLLLTSFFFGLAHFNKRAAHFNWRYVLLATLAGVFYGRAWRADRRISASAITHACVDTVWGALLR
jgi:membrane protease YdiL (CAAX protease family)